MRKFSVESINSNLIIEADEIEIIDGALMFYIWESEGDCQRTTAAFWEWYSVVELTSSS